MDPYSIHGDQYYQGYPVQAPPPGTAPNQILPPGAVPPPPSVPTSTPLAPPGVALPPSSSAASYYGSYAPPPSGYVPPPAERWSSYPVPAAEPHPYPLYPPNAPYERPGYGHHPYHQQEPFRRHAYRFPSPPQTHMPLPPRGSDVTRFRKKRPFLPHQNPRLKNKPFKQPQENFRGGCKTSQQVKKALDSDPRTFNLATNGFAVANSAQVLHPFWHGRIEQVPANHMGKKRTMDERGEGRHSRNDDRRTGDKRARPGGNKGKRKKGRNQGGDNISMDSNTEAKVTSPTIKSVDGVPVAEEQAQEAANWSDLSRDVRRRVQEFLHTSERETLQKRGIQDTQEPNLNGAGEDVNAAMQEDTQEPVGGDADIEDTQEGRQAAGGVANAEARDVGGDANATMGDTTEAAVEDLNAETQGTEKALEEAMHADANAQEIDAVQSEEPHADEANVKKLDIVDILKTDCENAPRLATEIVQDLEVENVQECPGVDEAKHEQNDQQPLSKTAHNFDKKDENPPEAPTQDDMKEREEKAFDFFNKLWEENKDLKKLYIENCNNGAFECLMCHSKIKKRFSNLVSLVTHANNVLKTKKLPEHRGYGRAVCALLGWDPVKYPKVPKGQVSHSGVENVPAGNVRAPLGDGDECAPVSNLVGHANAADAMEDGLQVDALKGVAVVDVAESKRRDNVDESSFRGEADYSVHTADDMAGEPAGDADQTEPRSENNDSVRLVDADTHTPSRDTGSSVDQEELVRGIEENIVDQGGSGEELTKDSNAEQEVMMVSKEVERENEGGNEQVEEEVGIMHVPKPVQAGAEITLDQDAELE